MPHRPTTARHRLFVVAALAGLSLSGPTRGAAADATTITPADPASVERGILAAFKAGKKSVKIPPGVYRLPRPENSPFHLRFQDLKDFTIDATGVTFVFPERDKRSMLFNYCENLTVRGLTLLRDVPPFSQGKIVAIAADRASVDVKIDAGYPPDIDDKRFFPRIPVFDVYEKGTRRLKPLVPDLYLEKLDRLGPDTFRFQVRGKLNPAFPVEVGDPVAWRGPSGSDISTWSSKGVRYENVTIKNGTGIAFFELAGEGGHTYDRCTITYAEPPKGATDKPLLSCGTDGFHSGGVRRGPTIQNCNLEGLNDDTVNIHGSYAMLMKAKGTEIIVDVRPFHSGAREPIPFVRPGDRVKLYDGNRALAGEAKAVKIERVADYKAPEVKTSSRLFRDRDKAEFWRVTLDAPVTGNAGEFVANADQCGNGFVIRGNTFKNSRAHGMLIRAGDGLIENNTIEGCMMGGIVVAPEMFAWNEADYAKHLVIRGNTLRNAGTATQSWNGGITVACFEGAFAPLPGGHRDIRIENNTIENGRNANIVLTSTIGAIVRGNKFVRPMTEPPFRADASGVTNDGALIYVRHAAKVVIENNTATAPGPHFKTLIDADDTVTGLTDGVKRAN